MLFTRLLLHHWKSPEIRELCYLTEPGSFPKLPSKKGDPEFILLRIPSFEAYCSWAFYKQEDRYRIRRIEWDPGMKLPQTGQPPRPTEALGTEAELDAAFGTALHAELMAMSVPLVQAPKMSGWDGTSYGIIAGSHLCATEFSWWMEPPSGWSELGNWYDKALAAFEAVLPPSPFGDPRLR